MKAILRREPGYSVHQFKTEIPAQTIYTHFRIEQAREKMKSAGFRHVSGDVMKGVLGAGGFSSDNANAHEEWENDKPEPLTCCYWPKNGAACEGSVATFLRADPIALLKTEALGCCSAHFAMAKKGHPLPQVIPESALLASHFPPTATEEVQTLLSLASDSLADPVRPADFLADVKLTEGENPGLDALRVAAEVARQQHLKALEEYDQAEERVQAATRERDHVAALAAVTSERAEITKRALNAATGSFASK
jgi:hypothetical protein